MQQSNAVIVLFGALTLAFSFLIGVYFTRRQRSLTTYYLAEKGLPPYVVYMSMAATVISGWTFIGGPGLGYAFGYAYLFTYLSFMIFQSTLLSWLLQARKFRVMADTHDTMTVPDVVYARYRSNGLRLMTALSVVLGFFSYLAAQVASLGWIMTVIFGVSYEVGLAIGLSLLGVYTALGGIQGAIYADIFQGVVMVIMGIVIGVIPFFLVGGIGATYEGMKAVNPRLVDPQGLWNTPFIWTYFAGVSVGAMHWPQLTTRYFMFRNLTGLRWSPLGMSILSILMAVMVFGIPWAYLTLQAAGNPGAPKLAVPDTVTPTMLANFFPGAVGGIALAGALAAILSTSSGFLNVGSAALVRDIWQGVMGRPLANPVLYARLGTIIVLAGGVLLSLAREYVVFLGAAASALWGSTLVPVVTLGINYRKASKEAAWAVFIFGFVFGVGLQLLSMLKIYTLPFGIMPGGVSTIGGLLVWWIVCQFTKGSARENLPENMEKIMRMPIFTRPRLPVARVAGGGDEGGK